MASAVTLAIVRFSVAKLTTLIHRLYSETIRRARRIAWQERSS
jgi:hypothetical protein